MSFQKTHTLAANLCNCSDADKFVIAGNPELFSETGGGNITLLADRNQRDFTIFDSILVFCQCGKLTIHYPTKADKIWFTRKMWNGWRGRRTKLVWHKSLPDEQRSLCNVEKIQLLAWWDAIDKTIHFVNDPNNNFNIHNLQLMLAEEIFTDLLFSCIKAAFFRNINFRIRDVASTSATIALSLIEHHGPLAQTMPDIIQELYNLRHISKSRRFEALRIALQVLCSQASIPLPKLISDNTGQPESVKDLAAA